ncbi:MAG TPA: diguanylate cyclase [Nitrospiria bacterium]|nr:diguanylate cyclase [Nitrospiria bacterium]
MAFDIERERLKELFYHTSEGVFILDSSLNILLMNPSAEEITGWNNRDKAGKRFPVECLIPISTSPEGSKDSSRIFNPFAPVSELEFEVQLSHGQKLLFPGISFPIPGDAGVSYFGLLVENILLKYGMGTKMIGEERTDDVTGLNNRTYFNELASVEIKRLKKYGGSLGGMMVQISSFSQFQAKFGTLKGMEIIKKVAQIVKGNSREVDIVGRTSENEFMVLLINSDAQKMKAIFSRLKEKLAIAEKKHDFPPPVKVLAGNILLNDDFDDILDRVKLLLENK